MYTQRLGSSHSFGSRNRNQRYQFQRRRCRAPVGLLPGTDRRGSIVVLTAFVMVMIFAFTAFGVDVGWIALTRSRLQNAADGAALAGILEVADEVETFASLETRTHAAAADIAHINLLNDGNVLEAEDISLGLWDRGFRTFTETTINPTAVRVTVRRSSSNGNPLSLFFAPLIGHNNANVSTTAIAAVSPVQRADILPIALRTSDFGPVDPKVSAVNPGKDGPSAPDNYEYFEIGDQVTLFTYGKGKQPPVHLTLNIDVPGPGAPQADVKKVLRGALPPVSLSIGDEYLVFNEGTGAGGYGEALDDRVEKNPPESPLRTIIVPVVEELSYSRNVDGQLSGPVRIVDFVAVRLDAIVETSIPDPSNPSQTIQNRHLVGTVIRRFISAGLPSPSSSKQPNSSVFTIRLVQ